MHDVLTQLLIRARLFFRRCI